MANELEAIGLNNNGVSLLERGSVWEALETFHYARACLDDDEQQQQQQQQQQQCQCRLFNAAAGPQPFFSLLENSQRALAHALQLYEGKHCSHIIGYDWVDCKPKHIEQTTPPCSTSSRSRSIGSGHGHYYHQQQPQQPPKSSTHSLLPPPLSAPPVMSHDYSRLVFLSLGAVKISYDMNYVDTRPAHLACDCATRWAIFYNLAIAHHMIALPLGERGHVFLQHAHQYYLLAQCTVPTMAPFGDIVRLLLSSQNNQMSIYQEFAMHAEAKTCLELLTQLLTILPTYLQASQQAAEAAAAASASASSPPPTNDYHSTSTSSSPMDQEESSSSPSSAMAVDNHNDKIVNHEILLNLMVLMRTDSAPAA